MRRKRRRVAFVTGTRAEFGLMRTTLKAIRKHPALELKIIATGMHLDRRHGDGLRMIGEADFTVDAVVPWKPADSDATALAISTGAGVSGIAAALDQLQADVVVVVGDRVEAFAAATAAFISGRILAHIHGGDRAAGQVDDCLRHAISKMAHLHFPATAQSRGRLIRMGEDRWRIHLCGSPGVDQIGSQAKAFPGVKPREFALVVHHPIQADDSIEQRFMHRLLRMTVGVLPKVVVIYPNNDPGSAGIQRAIQAHESDDRLIIRRDVERSQFLGLMRDCAVMIGNSSSGIIEAGSFGTPVIDIGHRQNGRERGANVAHVPAKVLAVRSTLQRLSGEGFPRCRKQNIYGGDDAGQKIAGRLAAISLNSKLSRKLIAY